MGRQCLSATKGALIFLLITTLVAALLPTISLAKPVSTETHFQAIILATIDPTANLPSMADAYVSDKHPKQNYGASTGMYVGHDLDMGTFRSFVRFDLSGIPSGATINSASFNAYATMVSGTPRIGLYPVHSSWGEGMVTWNNQPDVDEFATVAKVVSQADVGKWVSWNLTWLVGVWVAGSDNYGVCLQAPEGGYAEFYTQEMKGKVPYLLIDYTAQVPPADNTPPQVSISYSPESPTTEDQVTFTAVASDAGGIQKIEILVNADLVKTCTGSPCTYTGGPYPEGTVTYGTNAYDKAGNQAWTGYLSFVVGAVPDTTPPQISITYSPKSPTTQDQVTFTATASDLASGIQKIEILVNASLVKTCTSSPCTYTGGPYPEGTVTYGANAYDNAGNTAWTGYLSFAVEPAPDNTPPQVSISYSPESPTTEDQVTFTAVASDAGGIQKIEILVNADLVKTCTGSPCTYTGGPYPEGTVTYGTNAYDKAGNTAWTGYLSFVVGPVPDTTPPQVSITYSPKSPTTQDQVTFTATASDLASGIQKIEILVNASLVKTCTSSPCTYTGGPYPEGTVTYGANAYDRAGNGAWTGYKSLTVARGAAITSPKVSISPASQTVRAGDYFTIDIYVEPAGRGVSGASVQLVFDATAMQVDKVGLGNLLGASPILATGFPKIDNAGGLLQVDAGRTGTTVVPTARGVFARVELIVETDATLGTYNLNLKAKLADENSLDIPDVVIEEGTMSVFQAAYPRWDINEDGKVDIKDLAILGAHYAESPQPPYPRYDIDEDGAVGSQDLSILGAHYGEGTGQ